MEELETSPQGVSPEPEPASQAEAASTATSPAETPLAQDPAPEVPAEDAAPEPTLNCRSSSDSFEFGPESFIAIESSWSNMLIVAHGIPLTPQILSLFLGSAGQDAVI